MADTLTDILTGLVQVKMVFNRIDGQEIGFAQNKKNDTVTYSLEDGRNSGQAEFVYADTRTVAPQASDTVDLLAITQGTLEADVSFAFEKLRVMRFVNKSTTANQYLYFGASEANPSEAFAIAVAPGSEALLINHLDSYLVNSTNNLLTTYNPNGVAVTYELYLIGSPV